MKEEDELYSAIERLNIEKSELYLSREYKIGAFILLYYHNLKHLKFNQIIRSIKNRIICKKYREDINCDYENGTICINRNKDEINKRIVLYSCIIGDYDSIQMPLLTFKNVDYVIFVDEPKQYKCIENKCKIVKIPDYILQMDMIYANRYIKMHPWFFFNGYDYSIYMDGNIRAVGDIRQFVLACDCKTGIAMHKHRLRDCIYEDAEICRKLGRGKSDKIIEQIVRYKEKGFPEHFGMNEAGVVVVDLNNEMARVLLNVWWDEFVTSGSMRDQISWPFILWNSGIQFNEVGSLGKNIFRNGKIEITKHKQY